MNESWYFAQWIGSQKRPSILWNQSQAVKNIMDRVNNEDLISVLFNGSDEEAIKALKVLKHRYEDEQYWLDQISSNYMREMADETDWG